MCDEMQGRALFVRGVWRRHKIARADMESAPTATAKGFLVVRRGAFYMLPRAHNVRPYKTAIHCPFLPTLWCSLVPAASNARQASKNSCVIFSPGATKGTPGG